MDNNNFDAMKASTPLAKPVTRKTIDVSQRRFTEDSLKRDAK